MDKLKIENCLSSLIWLLEGGTGESGYDTVSIEYENQIYDGTIKQAKELLLSLQQARESEERQAATQRPLPGSMYDSRYYPLYGEYIVEEPGDTASLRDGWESDERRD